MKTTVGRSRFFWLCTQRPPNHVESSSFCASGSSAHIALFVILLVAVTGLGIFGAQFFNSFFSVGGRFKTFVYAEIKGSSSAFFPDDFSAERLKHLFSKSVPIPNRNIDFERFRLEVPTYVAGEWELKNIRRVAVFDVKRGGRQACALNDGPIDETRHRKLCAPRDIFGRRFPAVFNRPSNILPTNIGYAKISDIGLENALSKLVGFYHRIPLLGSHARIPDNRQEHEKINNNRRPLESVVLVLFGAPFWCYGAAWWKGLYDYPSGRWGYVLATLSIIIGFILCVIGINGLTVWSIPS